MNNLQSAVKMMLISTVPVSDSNLTKVFYQSMSYGSAGSPAEPYGCKF